MKTKHYGIVENIVGNEGEGLGSLSVTALLDPSVHMPATRICVGSPASSEVDLGQFIMSRDHARALIKMLTEACLDVEAITGTPR